MVCPEILIYVLKFSYRVHINLVVIKFIKKIFKGIIIVITIYARYLIPIILKVVEDNVFFVKSSPASLIYARF